MPENKNLVLEPYEPTEDKLGDFRKQESIFRMYAANSDNGAIIALLVWSYVVMGVYWCWGWGWGWTFVSCN